MNKQEKKWLINTNHMIIGLIQMLLFMVFCYLSFGGLFFLGNNLPDKTSVLFIINSVSVSLLVLIMPWICFAIISNKLYDEFWIKSTIKQETKE